jgi:anti-anti-sigma factor
MEVHGSGGDAALRVPVFATTEDAFGRRTLSVCGEIDVASAPMLSAFLTDHVGEAAAQGRSELDLDLSRVRFFSAAGLRSVLGAAERARGCGTTLRVMPSYVVLLVLDATRTRDRLDLRHPGVRLVHR